MSARAPPPAAWPGEAPFARYFSEGLPEVWAEDAAFMKRQPGFVSTQLHRGTAGSSTFVNVAEWESAGALGRAFSSPEFQQRLEQYPDSVVASPHVFEKVTIPGT